MNTGARSISERSERMRELAKISNRIRVGDSAWGRSMLARQGGKARARSYPSSAAAHWDRVKGQSDYVPDELLSIAGRRARAKRDAKLAAKQP